MCNALLGHFFAHHWPLSISTLWWHLKYSIITAQETSHFHADEDFNLEKEDSSFCLNGSWKSVLWLELTEAQQL